MNLDTIFAIPPEVQARTVGEEMAMLDLASGTYFGLDSVGMRLWQLLQEGMSLRQICDTMIEEFDVSREVLEQDVLALVRDLVDKKLVSPRP
jgi:Coenzyme PQQ synthesis protein D (PqqD)